MADRKYLYTERAHYMCPNMHFGIMAEIGTEFDADGIFRSIDVLRSAHPLMRSLIAEEQGSSGIYYEEHPELEIPVTLREADEDWQTDYDYSNGAIPRSVDEKLMESLDDLPGGSDLRFISRILIKDSNAKWRKEGHKVSYDEYLRFERDHDSKQVIKREIKNIDGEELDALLGLCRENGVSLNDYLIARMMTDEGTDKVVIASDIRNKIRNYKNGALGNYATAFGVVVKKRSSEIMELARSVDHEVRSIMSKPDREMLVLSCYFNMDPELLDAVAISTLGSFDSKAGRFVGSRMFGFEKRDGHCITNLGRAESSVIREGVFIPPASPANRKAWGVLTINDKMRICSIHSM